MDKLKYIKLEQPDGSYSAAIPLAVDSDYVDVNGNTLTNELNNKATKDEVQSADSNLQSQINVEKSRIDNITQLEEGSTTGDAELQDIRAGFDGNNYNTAGNAVRQQISKVNNLIIDGKIDSNITWRQVGDERRIWYTNANLPANITGKIVDLKYDITNAYAIDANHVYNTNNWKKTVITTNEYPLLAIRRNDKADISQISENDINNIVQIYKGSNLLKMIEDNIDEINILSNEKMFDNITWKQNLDTGLWFTDQSFSSNIKATIKNKKYQITLAKFLDANNNITVNELWGNSVTATEEYPLFVIREKNRENISQLTQEDISRIVYFYKDSEPKTLKRIDKIEEKIKKKKFAHISIDDCIFWKDLIDNANTYNSAFENEVLSYLKTMNEMYEAVFTLNCFCTSGNYSIENVPSKFASELSQCSNWLKFSFHSEDENTNYGISDEVNAITTSYTKFVNAIFTLTGNYDCVDRVVRLGFFGGTLANVKAIRDCQCGIVGLLTSDDNRVSYYLDNNTNNFILNHSKYYDAENQLMLLKSQTRLEGNFNISNYFGNLDYQNFANYYEFFTHEYTFSNVKNILNDLLNELKNNDYAFNFMQDVFKL